MEFDLTSFLELLIGNVKGSTIPFFYYIILLIALLIFFAIRNFLLVKKEDLIENKKQSISNFLLEVLTALGIGAVCMYLVENLLISTIFGIIVSIYIVNKISNNKANKENKKDDDNKAESDNSTIENNVNVVINNNADDNEKDDILPSFYDPNDLKLPENITSFNQLNIVMILEMYGYISPNQKFKMITQSLFETPDEQVEKLLEMYVLDERELKEARAILNLIKLNNRLISKEEALQCILEIENKQKRDSNKDGGENEKCEK